MGDHHHHHHHHNEHHPADNGHAEQVFGRFFYFSYKFMRTKTYKLFKTKEWQQ
jgi:hypothetical protein